VGVSGRYLWTFEHRKIQIDRPFFLFLLPSVIIELDAKTFILWIGSFAGAAVYPYAPLVRINNVSFFPDSSKKSGFGF